MPIIVLPTIYVHDCNFVTLFKDQEHECLEIEIGELKILVFSDDGIPVVQTINERETP